MVNLNDLKKIAQESKDDTNLSNLEQIVFKYLKNDSESCVLVKTLSKSEIEIGLNNFLDSSTIGLWLQAVNLQNLHFYLKLANPEINEKLKDWVLSHQDLKVLKAQVNLETLHCKLEQVNLTAIFTDLKIPVDCSEVPNFISSLQLLDESPNQYFSAQIVQINGSYKIIIGDGENQESERINWWQQNLVKPIQIATVCFALFAAIDAKADDQASAALNAAKGAAMATEQGREIKETVEQLQKRVTQAAEKIVKESGTEIPVTVVGYGVKAAVDRKVEIKKTSLQPIGLAMDANMAIGFDGSMNLGVGGKTPFLDNGNYKIQGTTGTGIHSIEMKLNFEF